MSTSVLQRKPRSKKKRHPKISHNVSQAGWGARKKCLIRADF